MADILFSQGFGTRRACAALVHQGAVEVSGRVVEDEDEDWATEGLVFTVNGHAWPFHARLLVLLHKPAGYECSREPRHHPSVLSLVPEHFCNRGLQPVGRLDQDTTGALLLTDHGPWLHRLAHPKRHVDKVYRVTTARDIDSTQVQALLQGVVLRDDPKPARAVACTCSGPRELLLTIDEGRYHQVKRMLAAVGNPVQALHRVSFGPWALPADLPEGRWLVLPPLTDAGATRS